jgi:hypothetical protein
MDIYLGPWEKGSRYSTAIGEETVCYYRPFLHSEYRFTENGNSCYLGEPEIFYNKYTELYFHGNRNEIDNYTQNRSLEKLQNTFDNLILERCYGLKDIKIVFLDQDRFDKLQLLI